jgi:hypothetical protein
MEGIPMNTLWQLWAVARTEFLFGLRRGGPVVGTAAVALVTGVGTLYLAGLNLEGLPRALAPEVGARALVMIWPVFQWVALGVMPIVAAPTIAADRQFGVDELLHSTPLTGGVYLLGKVLGEVGMVFATGAVALAVHLGAHWIWLGPVNVGLYVELTLLSGLPLLVWASAAGVVAGCSLRTRRNAVIVGMVVSLLSPYPWNLGFRPPDNLQAFQGVTSGLSRQPMSDFVFQRYDLLPAWASPIPIGQVAQTFLIALMTLLIAASLARWYLWWKENF